MQPTRILFSLAAVLLTQSVVAQGLPGALKTRLGTLEARTQALEDNAPNSSVEGRTYCFVLNMLIMRGDASDSTELLISRVIRRTFTFNGDGTFNGLIESDVLNQHADDGIVTLVAQGNGDVTGLYTQTGNKLDMMIFNYSANWYVSKDGSVIHGTRISQSAGGPITVGITRNWTLVENDTCDMEDQ